MSQISIHIHLDLAATLLTDGDAGARTVAALSRQAMHIVQAYGRRIAYVPVVFPNGKGACAMSARGGARGVIVEIDSAGTAIAGRGVLREAERDRHTR